MTNPLPSTSITHSFYGGASIITTLYEWIADVPSWLVLPDGFSPSDVIDLRATYIERTTGEIEDIHHHYIAHSGALEKIRSDFKSDVAKCWQIARRIDPNFPHHSVCGLSSVLDPFVDKMPKYLGPNRYAEICPSNLKAHVMKVKVRSESPKGYSGFSGEIYYNNNGKVAALDCTITRGSSEYILRLRECKNGLYVKEIKHWTVGCRTRKETIFQVGGNKQYEAALTRRGIDPWPAKSKSSPRRSLTHTQSVKTLPDTGGNKAQRGNDILELASEAGFEIIDKRDAGGCLWIVAGEQAVKTFNQWGEIGNRLAFKLGGGKATGGRDAWWVK